MDYLDKDKFSDYIFDYLQTVGEVKPDHWKEMSIEDYNNAVKLQTFTNDPTSRESRNDFPDSKTGGEWLVRYKYEGPKDSKNRGFCSGMLSINRLYTEEEIKNGLYNSEFSQYSIFDYKGSYGCRHRWARKIYFNDYEDGETRQVGKVPKVVSTLDDDLATSYMYSKIKDIVFNKGISEEEKQMQIKKLL